MWKKKGNHCKASIWSEETAVITIKQHKTAE